LVDQLLQRRHDLKAQQRGDDDQADDQLQYTDQ